MTRWMTVLVMVTAIVCGRSASAQDPGMSLLRMGTFADHAALAETYTSYARGAAAMYGNPAGLAESGPNSGALSYQSWIASTSIYAAAVRMQAGQAGGFGFRVAVFDGGDLDAPQLIVPGESAAMQIISASAGYAHAIGPLKAGIVAHLFSERIYSDNASGYAVDLGAQSTFADGNLLLGASVHNVGTMQELGAVASELPLMVRIGAAGYPVRIYSGSGGEPTFRFFIAPEIVIFPNDDVRQFRLGVGGEISELLSVRAGYLSGDDLRTLTFGAGVFYIGFQFDYAFLPLEEGFGGPSHMLTMTYGW